MASLRCTALFGSLLLACSLLACGGSVLPPDPDADADAGSNADADAGSDFDAGTDPDAGTVVEDTLAPTVTSTHPATAAPAAPINVRISATFSEAMEAVTLDATTFTVTQAGTPVAGLVAYAGATATFTAAAALTRHTGYEVTVTTGARDLAGNALVAPYTWRFVTGPTASRGPAPVGLGAAGDYVVLAKTAVSTVPSSGLTGNVGLSPAAASYLTGFSPVADSTNVFATATQVVGRLFAANYAVPTPANLATAVSNMEAAYTDAAGRPTPDFLELRTGDLGGQVLAPGLYKWTSTVTIPADVTFDGGADDVWILQTTGDLSMAAGKAVVLSGGAKAGNVFWQVAGQATFGANSHFEGVLLAKTAITLQTGATMNGRALAQTAVSLQQATITQPE